MLAISNSTALISCSIITYLTWLPKLYDKLLIPEEVYNEIVIKGAGKPGASTLKDSVKQGHIEVRAITDYTGRTTFIRNYGLDPGEAEVITLALEVDADIVIIDEDKAWEIANQFNDKFKTICLPFVLDEAEQLNYIDSSLNALRNLKQNAKYNIGSGPLYQWAKSRGLDN